MLVLRRDIGQSLTIDGSILIEVVDIRQEFDGGSMVNCASVKIEAPGIGEVLLPCVLAGFEFEINGGVVCLGKVRPSNILFNLDFDKQVHVLRTEKERFSNHQ